MARVALTLLVVVSTFNVIMVESGPQFGNIDYQRRGTIIGANGEIITIGHGEAQILGPDDLEIVTWNGKQCSSACIKKKSATGYEPLYKWCYTEPPTVNKRSWSYCGCPNMWFEKQHVCKENECYNEETFLAFMNKQRPPNSVDIYGEPYVALRNGAPVTTNTVFILEAGKQINYKAYRTQSNEIACMMCNKFKGFVAWECEFNNGEWSTCNKLESQSGHPWYGFGSLSNGHYIGRTDIKPTVCD